MKNLNKRKAMKHAICLSVVLVKVLKNFVKDMGCDVFKTVNVRFLMIKIGSLLSYGNVF